MLLSYIKYKATLFILLESATSIGAYIKTQMVFFEFILAMKFEFGSSLTWLTSWLSCVMCFLVSLSLSHMVFSVECGISLYDSRSLPSSLLSLYSG